jgi:hypothetical protein
MEAARAMTPNDSLWSRLQRLFWGPNHGLAGSTPGHTPDGQMHYEILLEGREPIEAWSVCTVCLNVDRTASVARRRWRCSDCSSLSDMQQPLPEYLAANPADVLDKNLREWGNAKGVRPAYKMLKSARFKCLMTLSRRRAGASPSQV